MAEVKVPEGFELVKPATPEPVKAPEGYEVVAGPTKETSDGRYLAERAVSGIGGALSLPQNVAKLAQMPFDWLEEKFNPEGAAEKKAELEAFSKDYPRLAKFVAGLKDPQMALMESGRKFGLINDAEPSNEGTRILGKTIEGALTAAPLAPLGPAVVLGGGALGGATGEVARYGTEQAGGGETAQKVAEVLGNVGGGLSTALPSLATKGAAKLATAGTKDADVIANAKAMTDVGVTPRSVSDLTGKASSSSIDGLTGGNTSRSLAQQTQDEIVDGLNKVLNTNPTTYEQGGQAAKAIADKAVTNWNNQIQQASQELAAVVPADSFVNIGNTKRAVDALVSRFEDPSVRALYSSEAIAQIEEVAKKAALKWKDADGFRDFVGAQTKNPNLSPTEQGLMKQTYKALSDDLRDAADAVPGGADAYAKFNALAEAKREARNIVTKGIQNAKTDEEAMRFLVNQRNIGATKIDELKDVADPADWQTVTDAMKTKMGGDDLGSRIDDFAKQFRTMAPEARSAFFGPDTDKLQGLIDVFGKTAASRSLANHAPETPGIVDAIGRGLTGLPVSVGQRAVQPWFTRNIPGWLEQNAVNPSALAGVPEAINNATPDFQMPNISVGQARQWVDSTDPQQVFPVIRSVFGGLAAQEGVKAFEAGPKDYEAWKFQLTSRPDFSARVESLKQK